MTKKGGVVIIESVKKWRMKIRIDIVSEKRRLAAMDNSGSLSVKFGQNPARKTT